LNVKQLIKLFHVSLGWMIDKSS